MIGINILRAFTRSRVFGVFKKSRRLLLQTGTRMNEFSAAGIRVATGSDY